MKKDPVKAEADYMQKQLDKIQQLRNDGYVLNEERSRAAGAVIMQKEADSWLIGMNGEVIHNPDKL
jgi:hypothetical protein